MTITINGKFDAIMMTVDKKIHLLDVAEAFEIIEKLSKAILEIDRKNVAGLAELADKNHWHSATELLNTCCNCDQCCGAVEIIRAKERANESLAIGVHTENDEKIALEKSVGCPVEEMENHLGGGWLLNF
jgi:hypothetical protein